VGDDCHARMNVGKPVGWEYGRCYLLFISQCGVKWGASGAAGGEYVNFKVSYCRFIGLLTVAAAAAAAEVRRVRR